jgi:hypothetical protein
MHAPEALHLEALHLEETHPLDAITAVLTPLLAIVGLSGLAVGAHHLAIYCGAVGVLGGLVGQMFSRTRAERFLDVVGLVSCAVVFAVGAAHGGLSFNG